MAGQRFLVPLIGVRIPAPELTFTEVYALFWANDVGAYIVGRSFGRFKLAERISPNKTWEGFVGGALIAICFGYLCAF